MTCVRVFLWGCWWLKITPPWVKGYRPVVTYRKIA